MDEKVLGYVRSVIVNPVKKIMETGQAMILVFHDMWGGLHPSKSDIK
jgi:hypothetical protein